MTGCLSYKRPSSSSCFLCHIFVFKFKFKPRANANSNVASSFKDVSHLQLTHHLNKKTQKHSFSLNSDRRFIFLFCLQVDVIRVEDFKSEDAKLVGKLNNLNVHCMQDIGSIQFLMKDGSKHPQTGLHVSNHRYLKLTSENHCCITKILLTRVYNELLNSLIDACNIFRENNSRTKTCWNHSELAKYAKTTL